eukprot:144_1
MTNYLDNMLYYQFQITQQTYFPMIILGCMGYDEGQMYLIKQEENSFDYETIATATHLWIWRESELIMESKLCSTYAYYGAGFEMSFHESISLSVGVYYIAVQPKPGTYLNDQIGNTKYASVEILCAAAPTKSPTNIPTFNPTNIPTFNPTMEPSYNPTINPTYNPVQQPTKMPTKNPLTNPTVAPTIKPTPNPTIYPTGAPTQSPTSVPTRNPTTHDQYQDVYNAHFDVIYQLRGLTSNNVQKIATNVMNVSHEISMIVERGYAESIVDLDSKNFWIKVVTIVDQHVEELRKYKESYLVDIFDKNKDELELGAFIECDVPYCDHIDEYYKEKLFVNITKEKLKKYFEDTPSNFNINAAVNNNLDFVVISMIYKNTAVSVNETFWDKYRIALVASCSIAFLFCISFIIYRYLTKKKKIIFISNVLVAIIGIEFYSDLDEVEPEIDGELRDLDAVSHDMENMKQLFSSLNYTVMTNKNKREWNSKEIKQFLEKDVVEELINDDKGYDGLIVTVSSHGLRDNIITSQYEMVDKTAMHRLVSQYRNDGKHRMIRDMPRIFLFDSCAGNNARQRTLSISESSIHMSKGIISKNSAEMMKGIEYKSHDNEWTTNDKNPDYNLLKIDAANAGFKAFGDIVKGSYLITSFVEKVKETINNNKNQTVINIFEEIQDDLHSKGKQLIQISPSGTIIKHIQLKRNDRDTKMYFNKQLEINELRPFEKNDEPTQSSRKCAYSNNEEEKSANVYLIEQGSAVEMNSLKPIKSTAL